MLHFVFFFVYLFLDFILSFDGCILDMISYVLKQMDSAKANTAEHEANRATDKAKEKVENVGYHIKDAAIEGKNEVKKQIDNVTDKMKK